MKTKIRILIVLVLLSAASLMILFGAPNTQSTGNPQTEPEVSVPSIVSTNTDKKGTRTLANTVLPSMRYASRINLNQPSLTLDRLDIRSFTLKPNQIGVNRSVAVSPNRTAQRFVNPDGSQIIALIIKSSGASGIGVHFRNFALADGEELYVYGTAPDSIVFGPFTDKGPWGDGEFWSGTVDGDTAVIEFYARTGGNGKAFEVFEISHIFTELDWRVRSEQPHALGCERDASCNRVRENNAVARIEFSEPDGTFVCTGTLLNDTAQDQCPYFLTANHCVSTQAVARTVEAYWFYQTTSCNSGVLRNWVHSPPGSLLLKTQQSNDISLLRLLSDIPVGAVFAGWTSAVQPIGTSVFGLHHPDGFIPPQIPSYLRRSDGTIRSPLPEPNGSCLVGGYEIIWASGLTEHGSSGSGLFTSNGHKLVGVLSCSFRPDICATPQDPAWDDYGKFSNFYPQIRPYIDSLAPAPPMAGPTTSLTSNSFKANWRSVCNAIGYRLDVATDNAFAHYVPGYQNLPVGNVTSRSVTGLNPHTTYYYRVRARNDHGTSDNSNVRHATTASAISQESY